jgi:cation-transporting ATPase E
LPPAVQEGQRVVNGMQQILQLFLYRVSSFILLILLFPGFPFSPRQSSLVTLLTVGIPTVALAVWAQPGPAQGKLLLLLLVFVAPPTRFLAGGNPVSGDWRPAILAGVLLVGLTVILTVPLGRAVFEISALPLFDVAAIVGVALLWALLLHFIWRSRALERVLGIAEQSEPKKGTSPSRSMRKEESI